MIESWIFTGIIKSALGICCWTITDQRDAIAGSWKIKRNILDFTVWELTKRTN